MANKGKKAQKVIDDSLSKIDSVLTVLNKLPNIEDALVSYGQGEIDRLLGKLAPDPNKFIQDLLTELKGNQFIIDVISAFLECALPAVELAVKGALIANMNELGVDYNIDPIITDKFLREGVVFDLKQIDLYDKLRVSPLDPKVGKYFYFGCDDCSTAAEVRYSALYPKSNLGGAIGLTMNLTQTKTLKTLWGEEKRGDFDALLWYMKQKAQWREVWYKRSDKTEYQIVEEIKKRRGFKKTADGWDYDKELRDKYKHNPDGSRGKKNQKSYKKKDGILTLEYSPRSGNIKQSNGNPMAQQTPYDSVLHVFLGNCKEIQKSKEISDNVTKLNQATAFLQTINHLYNRMVNLQDLCDKKLKTLSDKEEAKSAKYQLLNDNITQKAGKEGKEGKLSRKEQKYKERFDAAMSKQDDNDIPNPMDAIISEETEGIKEKKKVYNNLKMILGRQLGNADSKIDQRFYMSKDEEGNYIFDEKKIQTIVDILEVYSDIYNAGSKGTPTKQTTIEKITKDAIDLKKKLYVDADEKTLGVFYSDGTPCLYYANGEVQGTKPDGGWKYILYLTNSNPTCRLTISGLRNMMIEYVQAQETLVALQAQTSKEYPLDPKWNYYFRHLLMEWNFDYIMSLTLFDGRVLAARLISAVLGSFSMDLVYGLTLSWKQQFIQNKVKKILDQMIQNPDEASVDDCFFTFSNNQERDMLYKAELQRAGLASLNGEVSSKVQMSSERALAKLGEVEYAGTPEGRQAAIKGALLQASVELSDQEYDYEGDDFDNLFKNIDPFGEVNVNFLETLLTNLTTEVVMSVLSPKVYLCILVNLEMMGMTTNFDLDSFYEHFQTLIQKIIKQVYDEIMNFVLQKIEEILAKLFSLFAMQISLSQAEYYARLLRQIFDHIKQFLGLFKSEATPWNVDKVNAADIEEESKEGDNSETETINTKC